MIINNRFLVLYEWLSHSWFTGILVVGSLIALLFVLFGPRRKKRGAGTG